MAPKSSLVKQRTPRTHVAGVRRNPLLLFFYSPTSGPSRRMDSIVSWLCVREKPRMRFRAVNADVWPDLLRRFGVTTVPALVLIKDREVVGCLEGRATGSQIEAAFLPYLRS